MQWLHVLTETSHDLYQSELSRIPFLMSIDLSLECVCSSTVLISYTTACILDCLSSCFSLICSYLREGGFECSLKSGRDSDMSICKHPRLVLVLIVNYSMSRTAHFKDFSFSTATSQPASAAWCTGSATFENYSFSTATSQLAQAAWYAGSATFEDYCFSTATSQPAPAAWYAGSDYSLSTATSQPASVA
jgi:hypothetical protein